MPGSCLCAPMDRVMAAPCLTNDGNTRLHPEVVCTSTIATRTTGVLYPLFIPGFLLGPVSFQTSKYFKGPLPVSPWPGPQLFLSVAYSSTCPCAFKGLHLLGLVAHVCNASTWRLEKEDEKFKSFFDYISSSKSGPHVTCFNKNQNRTITITTIK